MTDRLEMAHNTLVGYSSNDFFYENPDYCGIKDSTGKYNVDATTETQDIITLVAADENQNESSGGTKTLCITNEKYGKLVKTQNTDLTSAGTRYESTLYMYNRELLRTLNYIAGVVLLGAYIYVNQEAKR